MQFVIIWSPDNSEVDRFDEAAIEAGVKRASQFIKQANKTQKDINEEILILQLKEMYLEKKQKECWVHDRNWEIKIVHEDNQTGK